jgi:hypothetical protein
MLTGLSKRPGQHGQAALFMTMTLTLSFGLIGLVVDLGWAYWRQEACLEAAQSAAMGGVMFAMHNNTTWPPATCTTSSTVVCQATATACPTNLTVPSTPTTDVQSACLYAQANGFIATGKQTVTIAANTGNPPTAGGVATAYYITARTTEQVPLTFLAVIAGRSNTTVAAVATAGVISTAAGDCVYVLDPSANLALNASNGSSIQSECGYWINSSGATALSVIGGASLTALDSTSINLVGGYTNANGGSISPATTHSSPAVDPFSTRNVPLQRSATTAHSYVCSYGTTGGCAHTSTAAYVCDHGVAGGAGTTYNTGGSNVTLSPGVWCGGITVGNVNSVTFNPGVYILDGGGMKLGSGGGVSGGVSGIGVSFFNTGTNSTYAAIQIINGANSTLSAPTSGSMAGLLFYQDPSLNPGISTATTSAFAGGVNLVLAGSMYFVNTAINFSNGTSSSTSSVGMVVYDVTFTGGAYFKHDGTNITSLGGTTTSGMVQ